jgi:hypothetical protein
MALIAAADLTGHNGVGLLLESCLADELVFVERMRRFIRNAAQTKLAERSGNGIGDRGHLAFLEAQDP